MTLLSSVDGSPIVLNLSDFDEKPKHPGFVLIARPSVFGNPHRMTKESERDDVIDLYAKGLRSAYKAGGHLTVEIDKLADRVRAGEQLYFGCWCAPKRCHGDVLAALVMEVAKEKAA